MATEAQLAPDTLRRFRKLNADTITDVLMRTRAIHGVHPVASLHPPTQDLMARYRRPGP